eukprot:s975_g32.t1
MELPEGSFGVAQVLSGLECAKVGEPRVADSLKMSLDTAATFGDGFDTQAGLWQMGCESLICACKTLKIALQFRWHMLAMCTCMCRTMRSAEIRCRLGPS